MNSLTFLKRLSAKAIKLLLQLFYLAVYFLAIKKRDKSVSRDNSHSLLIIRLDAIGDYILFRNYLERLRTSAQFRAFKITLCGNSNWKDLAEYFDAPFVNDFIWIDRKQFISNFRYTVDQLRRVRSRRFDIALQPTYSRDLADLILLASDAPRKIAFDGDKLNVNGISRWISNLFLSDVIRSEDKVRFELARNAEFFQDALGLPINLARPYFDDTKVNSIELDLPGNAYAVMSPGAGRKGRQWPTSYYATVAKYIREEYGLAVVIAGAVNDRCLALEIQESYLDVIDRTGALTLAEMTKLIKNAKVLVSNETMAVHMAVALGTGFVCISNGHTFGRFLPYPDSMISGSSYVLPDLMLARSDEYKGLVDNYSKWSDLDISAIAPSRVCEAVDRVLSIG
jgi:ADP-heptose:LPS heptosyltransferase